MANKNDFKKFMFHDMNLQYPKLDQTYAWDNDKGGASPCPQTATNAAWSCGFLVSHEEGQKLWNELKAHYNSCKAQDPSLGEFNTVFGMQKRDDGTVLFKAYRKGVKKSGDLAKAPDVIDGNMNDLPDRRIYSGSVGTLRVWAWPNKGAEKFDANGQKTRDYGTSLWLDKVQVTKAVYGDDSDFGKKKMEIEGTPEQTAANKAPDDFKPVGETKPDPFGLPPSKQPDATQGSFDSVETTSSSTPQPDFDEEIPF